MLAKGNRERRQRGFSKGDGTIQQYRDFEEDLLGRRSAILEAEVQRLQDLQWHAQQGCRSIDHYCEDAVMLIRRLNQEQRIAETERTAVVSRLSKTDTLLAEKCSVYAAGEQELSDISKKRVELARQLDIQSLAAMKPPEDNDQIHSFFRWILLAFYVEPPYRYNWKTFREQVLTKQRGQHFRGQLVRLDAATLDRDQRVATSAVIAQRESYKAETGPVAYEIEAVISIGQLMLRVSELSTQQQHLIEVIEEHRRIADIDQEAHWRACAKVEALRKRVDIATNYLSLLRDMRLQLSIKATHYSALAGEINEVQQAPASVTPSKAQSSLVTPTMVATAHTIDTQNCPVIEIDVSTSLKLSPAERERCLSCRSCTIF